MALFLKAFRIFLSISILHGFTGYRFLFNKECRKTTCPYGYVCIVSKGNERCVCNDRCKLTRETGPVCTEDGKTFKSLCVLHLEECRIKSTILVRHYGVCKEPCRDAKRESESGLCKLWQRASACTNNVDYMKTYCPLTCGFCKTFAPTVQPSCKNSLYGCCYGTKIAAGPNGAGCTFKCKDKSWCKRFVSNCGDRINKIIMKHFCPSACRYCDPEINKGKKKSS